MFGPQKGADATQIAILEAGLTRLALVLGGDPGAPGPAPRAGTGYGFAAAWGAEHHARRRGAVPHRRPGRASCAARDLVLTGEGRYDATSGDGKITGTVLAAAARAGVPAALVAGAIAADPPPGVAAVALDALAGGSRRGHGQPRALAPGGGPDPGGRAGRRPPAP